MAWNWELDNWPHFIFDPLSVLELEKQFLLKVGECAAYLRSIDLEDKERFLVEILCIEGMQSSKIEGETLDRESLQSSIRKHFGLKDSAPTSSVKETGMAKLLCDVYDTFAEPLTHKMLFKWHSMLFNGVDIENGKYRSQEEPMQIVSNRSNGRQVFFEAPPSSIVYEEMEQFIIWFNSNKKSDSIFIRAAISHVYFESIHPFEDGNGRIGRALVEKVLSQGVGKPILIAISKLLERNKKSYYAELEGCNRTLNVQHWIDFFSGMILKAQQESMELLHFLIEKTKFLSHYSEKFNARQFKVILRMLDEGVDGFKGGLSAENYIKIANTSRASASRDLSELVAMGALTKTGQLRHTRYWLAITHYP